ncbi:TonB-dependent receptor plug domain-containing protein [Aquisediminimonas sediminicola]|uniref:TonB-dependent receptor plug domain-containing protein n=1 Tax=Alteraquisediminimonas sediminicola TaxID=2676787 RepID=UPI001C8E744B|nr:TonB-dependent receptor [Aquisediminimonas sediminicola]
MHKSVLIFLSVSTAGLALPVRAEETGGDQIVVTASRSMQPLSQVGASISIIDADMIKQLQSVAVVDLLRTVPGVTFTRNGGIGTSTSVNIRGAESDQTVVLIDGVKINDPSTPGGGFNFGNLLTDNLHRIEIVRGAQSVLWGSQAIGGVVNLITTEPGDRIAGDVSAEYGWRDSARLTGNISGRSGPVAASFGGGYYRTDGISAFNEARGGKEREGFRHYNGNGKIKVTLSDAISLDLRGWYSDGKTGIDGFPPPTYSFADTDETARTKELVGYSGLNIALFDGRLHNRFAYALTDTRRENLDFSTPTPARTFDAKGLNSRFEYQGVFDLADGWKSIFGAETEKASFKTSSYGGPYARAHARIDSVYGQLSLTPLAGLTLNGGARHDDHDTFGGKTTFAANGVYSPNGGKTALRASYGEGFKTPSLYQLFSNYGNTGLKPEQSHGWDMGITQQLLDGRIAAGVTWFARETDNQIIFISCPVLTGICAGHASGTYDNVTRGHAEGAEFTLDLHPVDALSVRTGYSYIKAENRDTGRDLPRRPRHSLHTSIDYIWAFGLKAGASLTHVGKSFDNTSNTRRLGDYILVDLRASFPLTERIEIYGRVENLFDDQYETSYRYGSPGRAAFAGLRLTY